MTIWILRFVPYNGGHAVDGFFRTLAEALAARDAVAATGQCVDDFGVETWIDMDKCATILTSTKASAEFTAALQSANATATRAYGLPSSIKGSTVQ